MKILSRILLLLLCPCLLLACAPTEAPAGGTPPASGGSTPPKQLARYMHFSFDDMEHCFRNLKTEGYDSIWDEPFLAALYDAHERYGIKFSLYVWKDVLHGQPDAYAEEWQAAADWLKIGLHSKDDGNFAEATYEEGRAAWERFVSDVYAMTGTYEIIDRIPRLHNFAGSAEALRGMQEAEHGALGFLAADDTRLSYALDAETCEAMREGDYVKDANGLLFLATDERCEWYRNELLYDILAEKYAENLDAETCYILFTHEYEVYDGHTVNGNFDWVHDAAQFFLENEIPFAFPAEFVYE